MTVHPELSPKRRLMVALISALPTWTAITLVGYALIVDVIEAQGANPDRVDSGIIAPLFLATLLTPAAIAHAVLAHMWWRRPVAQAWELNKILMVLTVAFAGLVGLTIGVHLSPRIGLLFALVLASLLPGLMVGWPKHPRGSAG